MSGTYFRASGKVRLDASGNGQVTISMPGAPVTIDHTVITVTTNAAEPTFELYVDSVSAPNLRDSSYSGSGDTSDTVHPLQAGQSLIGVWAGGDPGATATMNLSGTAG